MTTIVGIHHFSSASIGKQFPANALRNTRLEMSMSFGLRKVI